MSTDPISKGKINDSQSKKKKKKHMKMKREGKWQKIHLKHKIMNG